MLLRFSKLVLAAALVESVRAQCSSIAEIACTTDDFSTLCTAVKEAGLAETLSGGSFTVFAPNNDAFEKLGDTLADVLADKDLLTNILLFHAVEGEVLSTDLKCKGTVEMVNGADSRTVCQGESIFQKGGGNPRDAMPEIIAVDIEACNGYIHVVDEVLLPGKAAPAPAPAPAPVAAPTPTKGCSSIAEIACSTDDFSTLCTAVKAAGLDKPLSSGEWTVFAPTNKAFANLGKKLDAVLADKKLLTDVLLFHAVAGEVSSKDLKCKKRVLMANGDDSRTICRGKSIFQKGAGNPRSNMPMITSTDIEACNGLIHVVDEVMMP